MTLWTTTDINSALKINNTKTQIEVSGISIDTRTIKKGELFIPIEGQNYDGHDFIKEAFKNGASASLVNIKKRAIIDFQGNFIFVNNTMKSLSMLAEYSRRRIKNLITICITGSSGKTTLKEWIFETFKNEKTSYCTFGISKSVRDEINEISSYYESGVNRINKLKELMGLDCDRVTLSESMIDKWSLRDSSYLSEEKGKISFIK